MASTVNALASSRGSRRDNNIRNWYGAVGLTSTFPVFNGFLYSARAQAPIFKRNSIAKNLPAFATTLPATSVLPGKNTAPAYERLSVTQNYANKPVWAFDLRRNPANNLVSVLVEFSQAELQKTEADIATPMPSTNIAWTQIVLAYTISAPKVGPTRSAEGGRPSELSDDSLFRTTRQRTRHCRTDFFRLVSTFACCC